MAGLKRVLPTAIAIVVGIFVLLSVFTSNVSFGAASRHPSLRIVKCPWLNQRVPSNAAMGASLHWGNVPVPGTEDEPGLQLPKATTMPIHTTERMVALYHIRTLALDDSFLELVVVQQAFIALPK